MSDTEKSSCAPAGRVSWNELVSTDTKASAAYYGELFGWQAVPFAPKGAPAGDSHYTLFKMGSDDMGVAGMMAAPAPGIPAHWLAYVVVDNVDTALAKAVALGAKACTPVLSLGEVGRIAIIEDSQGARLGLHEPSK